MSDTFEPGLSKNRVCWNIEIQVHLSLTFFFKYKSINSLYTSLAPLCFRKAGGRIELTIRNLYDGLPVRRAAPCDGLEVRRTGKFISAARLNGFWTTASTQR